MIPVKVSIHIAYWYTKERAKYCISVINDYFLKWDVEFMNIYIHTNTVDTYDMKPLCIQTNTKKIHYIVHNCSDQPFLLTWKCREWIEKLVHELDVCIYCEDDIGIPFETFQYWYKYKDSLHSKNLDVGFIRVEKDSKNELFCSDILIPCHHPVAIQDRIFVYNHQNYCAFWICDKEELLQFINSEYWKYHTKFPDGSSSQFIRESSAIGYKMSYKASFYPVENNSVSNICFVYHLPNNYVNNPNCEQGKFNVKRLLSI